MSVEIDGRVWRCVECFEVVPMTEAEARARVDDDGLLVCDRCKPLHDLIERLAALHEAKESRRFWAAMMLARDVQTLESIRQGLPVHRCRLDRRAFARAGRGMPLSVGEWIWVTPQMLDAIAEAGPFR